MPEQLWVAAMGDDVISYSGGCRVALILAHVAEGMLSELAGAASSPTGGVVEVRVLAHADLYRETLRFHPLVLVCECWTRGT